MAYKISIYGIQILYLITETASNSIQPDYAVKVYNTETIILTLGDPDDAENNDLEIIKASPGKTALDKKMGKFRKYVNLMEMTEGLEQKPFDRSSNNLKNYGSLPLGPYQDTSFVPRNGDEEVPKRRKKKRKRKRKKSRSMNSPRMIRNPRIKKRQVDTETTPKEKEDNTEDDYTLHEEYMDYVNERMRNNTAYKYSDEGKPEENFKEIIYKITDVSTPQNCSEVTGIGVQAVECIVQNYRRGELDQKHMIISISKIVLVWFGVYLAIALPFWCIKGWCCCCFRCKFCLPNKTITEIQKYIDQNPPGIYVNSKGEEERYNPTQNEIDIYERLKRAINDF